MVTIYVLRSLSSEIYYIGISNDVSRRLEEHNRGKSKYTKGHMPWKIVYTEEVSDYPSARKREKYLKSTAGKN